MRLKRLGKVIIFVSTSPSESCRQCGNHFDRGEHRGMIDACLHLKCLSCIRKVKLMDCVQCQKQSVHGCNEGSPKPMSPGPAASAEQEKSVNKATTNDKKETGKMSFSVAQVSTLKYLDPKEKASLLNSVGAVHEAANSEGSGALNLPLTLPSNPLVKVKKKTYKAIIVKQKPFKVSELKPVRKLGAKRSPKKQIPKRSRKTKVNNGDYARAGGDISKKMVKKNRLFHCKHCEQTFKFNSWLLRHMSRHHA